MEKIINYYTQNKGKLWHNLKINILLNIILILGFKLVNLFISRPDLALTSIYFGIAGLSLMVVWLFYKKFNLIFKITDPSPPPRKSIIYLTFKIFIMQFSVWGITLWFMENLYWQSSLNPRINKIMPIWNYQFNGLISWLIFISLLLGLSWFKYVYQANSLRLAKCIFPKVINIWQSTWHNLLLGGEFYIRMLGIMLFFIIISINFFEKVAKFNTLPSFLTYAKFTASSILLIFFYIKKYLYKLIDLLANKYSLNLINILNLSFLLSGLIIFIFVQLFLQHGLEFKLIDNNVSPQSAFIQNFVANFITSNFKAQTLSLGLQIILVFAILNDQFIEELHGYKVWKICLISIIFPASCLILDHITVFSEPIKGWFRQDFTNYLAVILILGLMQLYYQKVQHLFCFSYQKFRKQQLTRMVDFKFANILKKLVLFYFVYLSLYYIFAWICVDYLVTIGGILTLAGLYILIGKILFLEITKNSNDLQLKNKDLSLEFQ